MSATLTQWIGLIIAGLFSGGAGAALLRIGPDRRKVGADTTQVMWSTARDEIEYLTKELTAARDQVRSLHQETTELRVEVTELSTALHAAHAELGALRPGRSS